MFIILIFIIVACPDRRVLFLGRMETSDWLNCGHAPPMVAQCYRLASLPVPLNKVVFNLKARGGRGPWMRVWSVWTGKRVWSV